MEKSEWIKWEGGECPVPKQTGVEYETRTGSPGLGIAGDLRWDHINLGGDIVAYRVVKEATKPTSPEDIAPELWNAYKDVLNEGALSALRNVILDTEKHRGINFSDAEYLVDAFTWDGTRHGYAFWDSVDNGEYDKNMAHKPVPEVVEEPVPEYTGGSSSYYKVDVSNPVSAGDPYTVECQDVIEALDMSFSEGNIFKAIWRICAAKKGKAKKGYEDSVYDLEKIIFFAQRELQIEKMKRG
jgi:hypothetical protein